MSLSILNNNHISQQDIVTLAQCNLSTEVIAVKTSANQGSRLVILSKEEITFWQLFLRFFGKGNLAHLHVHLKKTADHLNQFNWSLGTTLNPISDHYLAYLKVCALANKALSAKKEEALFNNVSPMTLEKKVLFTQYSGNRLLHRHDAVLPIKWNPAMQVKQIKAQLAKEFRDSEVYVIDKNYYCLSADTAVAPQALDQIGLIVEQRLYKQKKSVFHKLPIKIKPSISFSPIPFFSFFSITPRIGFG